MNIEIKNAEIKDLDLLVKWRMEVLENVFKEEFKGIPRGNVETIKLNNRNYYSSALKTGGHIACFAYVGKEIVGCGGICIYSEMPSPDNISGTCAYLMNIYTRKQHRNCGIATAIVSHLVNEARKLGIEKIYLEASEDGEHLYRKMGFKDMKGYMKL